MPNSFDDADASLPDAANSNEKPDTTSHTATDEPDNGHQAGLPLILDCYLPEGQKVDIRPAPQNRPWMDATPDQYAYRCLPLNIANSHGWEVLCPCGFSAIWSGGTSLEDIDIQFDDPDGPKAAISHFGSGIMTFHVSGLMRTEPGYDLWVTSPVNRPKSGIYGLTGLIETDWLPFTFTMNWLFTDPDRRIRFEQDEPFCSFFPVPRGMLESFDPVVRPMEDESTLLADFKDYAESRNSFNRDLHVSGSDAQKRKWQKTYFQGPETPLHPPHRTKLRAKPFRQAD